MDDLLAMVYGELHALAAAQLRGERSDHTLQPTALVHEAYLRLVDERERSWSSRRHFLSVAGMAMRRVLVNHARDRKRLKRGGDRRREPLTDGAAVAPSLAHEHGDLELVDAALERLAKVDERKVRVVELRSFVGLSVAETAETLGVSPATVKRDWDLARAWLLREVRDAAGGAA